MTFTRAKPGGWQIGERLTSSQANHIDGALPDAIDGGAGGEYNPTNPLIIGGAGLRVGEATVDEMPVRKQELDAETMARVAGLAAKVTAGSARFSISNGTTVNPVNLTEVFASSGVTLVNGNAVELPEGTWFASALMSLVSSSTDSLVGFSGEILVGGTLTSTDGALRPTANASTAVYVKPFAPIVITSPATQRVTFRAAAGDGIPSVQSLSAVPSFVSFVRVG